LHTSKRFKITRKTWVLGGRNSWGKCLGHKKKTYTVSSLGMRLSVSPESMPCLNNLRFLRHEFFLLSQTIYCYFSIKKHISFFFNFVFLLFLHQKKHFFFVKIIFHFIEKNNGTKKKRKLFN
jgi:hypothetical protein